MVIGNGNGNGWYVCVCCCLLPTVAHSTRDGHKRKNTMTEPEPAVEEVAMSLCALGRTVSSCSDDDATKTSDIIHERLCEVEAAAHLPFAGSTSSGPPTHGFAIDCLASYSSSSSLQIPSSISQSTQEFSSSISSSSSSADKKGKRKAMAKKNGAAANCDVTQVSIDNRFQIPPHIQPRSHQQSDCEYYIYSIPIDEMERLMRVYGSLKCFRDRTPLTSDPTTKIQVASVRRKFYRWFPDLDERFEWTKEGCFIPKAGHEEEIQYREAMRKGDQDCLVRKRNTRRSSTKRNAAAPAV